MNYEEMISTDKFYHFDLLKNDKQNIDAFPLEFVPIVDLFAKDCKNKLREIKVANGILSISGNGEPLKIDMFDGDYVGPLDGNELELVYSNKQLKITSIQFVHRRQGNMTELFNILKDLRQKYNLKPIEFINCSDEMSAWCTKNNLQKNGDSFAEKVQTLNASKEDI